MNLLPADRLTTGPRRVVTLHGRCQRHATNARAAAAHGSRAISRGRRRVPRQHTAARVRDGRSGHRASGSRTPARQRARPLAFAARHRNAITNATGVTILFRGYPISAPCAQGRFAPLMLRWPSAPEVNSGASSPIRVRARPVRTTSEKRGRCAPRRCAPPRANGSTSGVTAPARDAAGHASEGRARPPSKRWRCLPPPR